jgi:paraquat-inducible protein B
MPAARPAIVGAFILGALALAVAAILFLGGSRLLGTTSTAVTFFDQSVAGLEVGAPVTFRGVRIGAVRRIAIRFSAGGLVARIPVFLEIEPNRITWEGEPFQNSEEAYRLMVAAGLRAQLVWRSFVTGQLNIDLDFHPNTPAVLIGSVPGVPEIPSVPPALEHLRSELTDLPLRQLVDTAQHALATVDRLAAHLDAAVDPLAERAQRSADAATRTLETTNGAVRQLQTDASATLHEIDMLATEARRELAARSDGLGRTLAAADRAARQAEALLTALNGLVAPRAAFRSDLEATARDLAASAGSLRDFARTLERDPSALLTGKRRP